MKNLRERIVPGAVGAGWAGIVALGVLVCLGAFYASALRPGEARLEALRQESARLRHPAEPSASRAPKSPAEQLAEFYAFFPAPEQLPDLLERIYAAAKRQALVLEQGEYRASRDAVGELMRYQLVLPVKGTYPQIRKFVDGALADVPTLSLESIQFERQKIGDSAVEAKLRLVVYVGKRS